MKLYLLTITVQDGLMTMTVDHNEVYSSPQARQDRMDEVREINIHPYRWDFTLSEVDTQKRHTFQELIPQSILNQPHTIL